MKEKYWNPVTQNRIDTERTDLHEALVDSWHAGLMYELKLEQVFGAHYLLRFYKGF